MAHHQKADVLMTASRALAEEITSFLWAARRWLAIFGVSVLLITFLLASPIVLGEYAQQILSTPPASLD
jgi:branched-chain amino acid transport system permease protein